MCFLKTEKLNTEQNKLEQNKRKTKNQKPKKKTKRKVKKVRTEIGLRNHYHRFFHSFIHSLIHSFHPFSLSFFISLTHSSYSHRTILSSTPTITYSLSLSVSYYTPLWPIWLSKFFLAFSQIVLMEHHFWSFPLTLLTKKLAFLRYLSTSRAIFFFFFLLGIFFFYMFLWWIESCGGITRSGAFLVFLESVSNRLLYFKVTWIMMF